MKIPSLRFTFQDKKLFLRELSLRYENSIAVLCPHENLISYYKREPFYNKKIQFYGPAQWQLITESAVVLDEDYFFRDFDAPYIEIFYAIASESKPVIGMRSTREDYQFYPMILQEAYFNRLKYEKYFKAKPVKYIKQLRSLLSKNTGKTFFISHELGHISRETIEIITGEKTIYRLGGGKQGFFPHLKAFYHSVPRIFFDRVVKLRLLFGFY